MNFNKVIMVGNITRDPELTTLESGNSLCSFGFCVNNDYKGKDGNWVKAPCFIDITCWQKTAENVAKLFRKGNNVLIEGKLVMNTWEKDGVKHQKHKITASRVAFTQAKPKNESGPAPEDIPSQQEDDPTDIGF